MSQRLRWLLKIALTAGLLTWLLMLGSCATPSAIPVVERKQPPSKKINHHWVAEGETLYAIAWRYNLDVERLARANGLSLEQKILVGQRLQLDVNNRSATGHRRTEKRQLTQNRNASNPVRPGSVETGKRVDSNWHWPTHGKVSKAFSFSGNRGHKGIDINARSGQAVLASQEGVVVYAGSGLPAYGNLLIVKHAENYLSAYAHNSKLMVGEGTRVRTGQKIAEVGKTGTTHDHLYFEIRKRGVPVDPLRFLRTSNS